MQYATGNFLYPQLVGEPLRLEMSFTLPPQQDTELLVFGETPTPFAVHKLYVNGKTIWDGLCFLLASDQLYPANEVSAAWFTSLWLYSNSFRWNFCHYNYATQQYVGWAVSFDCKLWSQLLFCRISWSIQFLHAEVQADDTRATTIPTQRFRFLHDLCNFSTLQVPIWRNCSRSRC